MPDIPKSIIGRSHRLIKGDWRSCPTHRSAFLGIDPHSRRFSLLRWHNGNFRISLGTICRSGHENHCDLATFIAQFPQYQYWRRSTKWRYVGTRSSLRNEMTDVGPSNYLATNTRLGMSVRKRIGSTRIGETRFSWIFSTRYTCQVVHQNTTMQSKCEIYWC